MCYISFQRSMTLFVVNGNRKNVTYVPGKHLYSRLIDNHLIVRANGSTYCMYNHLKTNYQRKCATSLSNGP